MIAKSHTNRSSFQSHSQTSTTKAQSKRMSRHVKLKASAKNVCNHYGLKSPPTTTASSTTSPHLAPQRPQSTPAASTASQQNSLDNSNENNKKKNNNHKNAGSGTSNGNEDSSRPDTAAVATGTNPNHSKMKLRSQSAASAASAAVPSSSNAKGNQKKPPRSTKAKRTAKKQQNKKRKALSKLARSKGLLWRDIDDPNMTYVDTGADKEYLQRARDIINRILIVPWEKQSQLVDKTKMGDEETALFSPTESKEMLDLIELLRLTCPVPTTLADWNVYTEFKRHLCLTIVPRVAKNDREAFELLEQILTSEEWVDSLSSKHRCRVGRQKKCTMAGFSHTCKYLSRVCETSATPVNKQKTGMVRFKYLNAVQASPVYLESNIVQEFLKTSTELSAKDHGTIQSLIDVAKKLLFQTIFQWNRAQLKKIRRRVMAIKCGSFFNRNRQSEKKRALEEDASTEELSLRGKKRPRNTLESGSAELHPNRASIVARPDDTKKPGHQTRQHVRAPEVPTNESSADFPRGRVVQTVIYSKLRTSPDTLAHGISSRYNNETAQTNKANVSVIVAGNSLGVGTRSAERPTFRRVDPTSGTLARTSASNEQDWSAPPATLDRHQIVTESESSPTASMDKVAKYATGDNASSNACRGEHSLVQWKSAQSSGNGGAVADHTMSQQLSKSTTVTRMNERQFDKTSSTRATSTPVPLGQATTDIVCGDASDVHQHSPSLSNTDFYPLERSRSNVAGEHNQRPHLDMTRQANTFDNIKLFQSLLSSDEARLARLGLEIRSSTEQIQTLEDYIDATQLLLYDISPQLEDLESRVSGIRSLIDQYTAKATAIRNELESSA